MKRTLTLALIIVTASSVACERRKTVSKDPKVETETAPTVPTEDEKNVPSMESGESGGNDEKSSEGSESAEATVDDDGIARITMVVGDAIAYRQTKLKVSAKAKRIELTLEHDGKQPVEVMGHNVTFLKPGTDAQAVSQAAISAKKNGYIPPKYEDAILAHTEMIGGGQSDTVTFDAPDAGTYTFICTFPGHYPQMQGELVVARGGA